MGRAEVDTDYNDESFGVEHLFDHNDHLLTEGQCLLSKNAIENHLIYNPNLPSSPLHRPTLWNNFCRWIENSKFLGAGLRIFLNVGKEKNIKNFNEPQVVDLSILVNNLYGMASGVGLAFIFHWLFYKSYSVQTRDKPNPNPFYRVFKTLASFGAAFGSFIAAVLQGIFPNGSFKFFNVIFGDIAAIFFGLCIFPLDWIRNKFFKTTGEDKEKNKFAMLGLEGWSKYSKTALVFGISLGQVLGGIFSFITHANMSISLAVGAGIFSVTSFFSSLVVIPLINKYKNGRLIAPNHDKDWLRNNYLRTGITLGLAIGSTVGFFLGAFLFASLGPAAAMTIGGAIGSVLLAPVLGKYGKNISAYVNKHWKINPDTDNSWDYATRNTSYTFAFLFSAIGFFLPIPGGALMGAALGNAVGGIVGWFVGLAIIKIARTRNEVEKPANTVPWTQRMGNGANFFSFVGSAIGCLIGSAFIPLGPIAGATIGFACGGFFGSVLGAVYDPAAKHPAVEIPKPTVQEAQVTAPPLLVPTTPRMQHISVMLPPVQKPTKQDELEIEIVSDTIEPSSLSRTNSSPKKYIPHSSSFFRAETAPEDDSPLLPHSPLLLSQLMIQV